MSRLFNITAQHTAKVLIVRSFVAGLSDILSIQSSFIKKGFSKDDILYYSLFNKKPDSIGVAELRIKILELAEFCKVHGNINLIVDEVGYVDVKGKYNGNVIFSKVFGKSSAWNKRGVFLGTIDDVSIKFVSGTSRTETIKREMESKKIIDSEFAVDVKNVKIIEVSDLDGLKDLHSFLKDTDEVLFDIETSSLRFDTKDSRILCLQFGKRSEPLVSYVVWYDKAGVSVTEAYKKNVKQFMQKVSQKTLVAHNGSSFDVPWICWHFDLNPLDIKITDTLVLTYIARNSTRKQGMGLKEIVFDLVADYDNELDVFKKQYLKEHKMKDEDFCYDFIPKDILVNYSAWDITALAYLLPMLEKECKEHIGGDLYEKVWLGFYQEYCSTLAKMSLNGIPFNLKLAEEWKIKKEAELEELIVKLNSDPMILKTEELLNEANFKKALLAYDKKVSEAQAKGKTFSGKKPCLEDGKYGSISFDIKFNSGSAEHKRQLFFNVLGLKPLKDTATGATSVDSETATKLAKANPNIEVLGLFEGIAKYQKELSSFYIPYIEMSKSSIDGRIRGSYRINGTISTRLSQTSPNILQIPSKSDFKYLISHPEDSDYYIVGCDVSSLESNIATMLSGDKAMYQIRDYAKSDAHSYLCINLKNMGVELFQSITEDNLDSTNIEHIELIKSKYPKLRGIAKTINFSAIFGIGASALASDLGLSFKQGEELLEGFWSTHYGLRDYFERQAQHAKEKGYVVIEDLGFCLLTPDADNEDLGKASASARSSNNFTIQGYAYITHKANIWINKKIREENLDVKVITTIHDCIYLEAHKKDLARASVLAEQAMTLPFRKNQEFMLDSPPEIGRTMKGGFEIKGNSVEEKMQKVEEWLREN